MSKDKYPSIFSKSNGGYCVYYPSNIFRNTSSFELVRQSQIVQSAIDSSGTVVTLVLTPAVLYTS